MGKSNQKSFRGKILASDHQLILKFCESSGEKKPTNTSTSVYCVSCVAHVVGIKYLTSPKSLTIVSINKQAAK